MVNDTPKLKKADTQFVEQLKYFNLIFRIFFKCYQMFYPPMKWKMILTTFFKSWDSVPVFCQYLRNYESINSAVLAIDSTIRSGYKAHVGTIAKSIFMPCCRKITGECHLGSTVFVKSHQSTIDGRITCQMMHAWRHSLSSFVIENERLYCLLFPFSVEDNWLY